MTEQRTMSTAEEFVADIKALFRWIDSQVGVSNAIIVLLSAIIIALVSFWAVNTYA
jgi:hypothetical protein